MKIYINIAMSLLLLLSVSCNFQNEKTGERTVQSIPVDSQRVDKHEESTHVGHSDEEEVHLTAEQMENLEIETGPLMIKVLSDEVQVNGKLELPPQKEAVVTSLMEGRVTDIKVIEGDKVKKGQTLALLQDPEIVHLQTDLMEVSSKLEYLRKEYERKKRLYEEKVGSGKEFQRVTSEYSSTLATFRGLKSQLAMLGINTAAVLKGKVYDNIRLTSPLDGYVKDVHTSLGNHVTTDEELFEIVNTDHIHADMMVFEKDISKVKEGQKIYFNTATRPGKEIEGEIFAVGKTFEEDIKAMHVHAEIDNKEGILMPGMYIKGRILIGGDTLAVLPEEAVVRLGDKQVAFIAQGINNRKGSFKVMEMETGVSAQGYIAVYPKEPLKDSVNFVYNAAYYLLAEMQKGEGGHHH